MRLCYYIAMVKSQMQERLSGASAGFQQSRSPDRQLIDFTLRTAAVKLVSKYGIGPLFTATSVSKAGGPLATITSSGSTGGANWLGGS